MVAAVGERTSHSSGSETQPPLDRGEADRDGLTGDVSDLWEPRIGSTATAL